MSIKRNPLDQDGVTPKGKRWQLMPVRVPDITVAYLDLRFRTGAKKQPYKKGEFRGHHLAED